MDGNGIGIYCITKCSRSNPFPNSVIQKADRFSIALDPERWQVLEQILRNKAFLSSIRSVNHLNTLQSNPITLEKVNVSLEPIAKLIFIMIPMESHFQLFFVCLRARKSLLVSSFISSHLYCSEASNLCVCANALNVFKAGVESWTEYKIYWLCWEQPGIELTRQDIHNTIRLLFTSKQNHVFDVHLWCRCCFSILRAFFSFCKSQYPTFQVTIPVSSKMFCTKNNHQQQRCKEFILSHNYFFDILTANCLSSLSARLLRIQMVYFKLMKTAFDVHAQWESVSQKLGGEGVTQEKNKRETFKLYWHFAKRLWNSRCFLLWVTHIHSITLYVTRLLMLLFVQLIALSLR